MRKKSLTFSSFFIVVDQIIKLFINNSFSYGENVVIIPNFLKITKVYNTGAAWSMFAGGRYALITIAICAFGLLFSYQRSFCYKERTVFGFALVYGGLIGNLLDRCLLGHVIDFIEVNIFSYHFPIFNIADMCLVMGFVLIMIALMKGEDKYGNNLSRKQRKNR